MEVKTTAPADKDWNAVLERTRNQQPYTVRDAESGLTTRATYGSIREHVETMRIEEAAEQSLDDSESADDLREAREERYENDAQFLEWLAAHPGAGVLFDDWYMRDYTVCPYSATDEFAYEEYWARREAESDDSAE